MRKHRASKKTAQVEVKPAPASASVRRAVLTVLSGGPPGLLVPIAAVGTTVGRTDESSLVLDDESLSRRHARFFCDAGRCFVEDLGSTNGTFVDGVPVQERVAVEEGARVQLGSGTVLRVGWQDEAQIEAVRRLYEASVADPLTGVYNRQFLDERLRAEHSYASRHGTPLSVLFVDADHFKHVNDTPGHAAGDEVLRRIAHALRETVRSEDLVARIGGEEFVVVLRGIPESGVLAAAERVRACVEALAIEHEGARIPVTVSVGAATCSPERPVGSPEALVAMADAALYRAKEAGRNRVWLA